MDSNEMKLRRRGRAASARASAIFAGSVCLVAWAAAAWACVPQAALIITPVSWGPPGTKVTVAGYRFGQGDVELRWNSLDGVLIAKETGPDFQADVTIPSDSTGLNAIVGFVRAPDGSVGTAIQVAEFNVTGAGDVSSVRSAPAASNVPASTGRWSPGEIVAVLGGVLLIGLIAGRRFSGRRRRPLALFVSDDANVPVSEAPAPGRVGTP